MKSFEVELQLVVFKGINLTFLCFKKIYMSLFWRLKLATAAKFSKIADEKYRSAILIFNPISK